MSVTVRGGLAPVRTALPNGVVVLAKETTKTPAVAINVAVRAGTVCDPATAPGLVHLMSRVIDRGTASRTADEIAEELDCRGISLVLGVNRHQVTAACTCLSRDFDAVLQLVADIVVRPTLPDAEIARRKGEVVTAIRQDDDNPAARATDGLMALLYGEGHPYGRRQKGTPESVERIDRAALQALHRERFVPAAASVVIVGDVASTRAVGAAAEAFGGWSAAESAHLPIPAPPAVPARRRAIIPMMNKSQADVAYGFTAIRRNDPRYYAFWLMNNALGQYALGGRLGDNIRERQGMAYYVSSILDANIVEGPLMIRAGVSPANVDRTIAAIDHELTRLRTEGLTAKELSESRQYLIGAMPRALETNAGIAGFLQNAEFFGLGLDYDIKLPGLLDAVTLDDVNNAARQTLDPDRASIVVAGPYSG
jgi:zinc protease